MYQSNKKKNTATKAIIKDMNPQVPDTREARHLRVDVPGLGSYSESLGGSHFTVVMKVKVVEGGGNGGEAGGDGVAVLGDDLAHSSSWEGSRRLRGSSRRYLSIS